MRCRTGDRIRSSGRVRSLGLAFAIVATMTTTCVRATELQRCLGYVCLGKGAPTYDQTKRKCNTLNVRKGAGFDHVRSLCEYDARTDTSAVVSFEGDMPLSNSHAQSVFVTRGKFCDGVQTKSTYSCFPGKTEDGLSIGNTKDDVIRVSARLRASTMR